MADSMKTRHASALAVATTLALLVGGATTTAGASTPLAPDGPPPEPPPAPQIVWQPCETEDPEVDLSAYECATIEVPMDYDRPAGRTTTIAVTRLPATDPDERIGSVLTNFGGPGGPGVETLHQVGEVMFDPQVREFFDVVSFDPRGVGLSDPVTCFPDPATEQAFLSQVPVFPVTPSEERRTIAAFTALAVGCQLISGDRLSHSSTANVARDMDVLRAALGDEELTYLGYSYGTILGATYSALFPDNVRALVLDGPIDPAAWTGAGSSDSIGTRMQQARGATETLGEFSRLCAEAGPESCVLAGLGDPAQLTEEVLQALLENPAVIPVDDGDPVVVTYQDVVWLLFQGMYSTAGWADLSLMLAQLAVLTGVVEVVPLSQQDEGLVPLGQQDEEATPLGQREGPSLDELLRKLGLVEDYPSIGGSLASVCMDTHNPLRLGQYPAHADAQDERYPHFGRLRAWTGAQCAPILVRDHDAYTGPWQQATPEPVLVIGTRFDPATPYEFTEPYAAHFPEARVLTVEGWGHTTLLVQSTCADAAIARYLIDLEAEDAAACLQDFTPFAAEAAPSPADTPIAPSWQAWWQPSAGSNR